MFNLSITACSACYQYSILDECHENDPGLTVDVVCGSVKEGLMST